MAGNGPHLRTEEVIELRRRYARGEQTRSLAAAYGRSTSMIQNIVAGRSFATVPGALAPRRAGNPGKLKERDVRAIRALKQRGMKQRLIAKRFGVSTALVSIILAGKIWSHVR
jgi:hypothetical protein